MRHLISAVGTGSMSTKFAALLCLLYVVTRANGEVEKPKAKKESPKYKIIGGSSEYEIRKYDAGIVMHVAVGCQSMHKRCFLNCLVAS